MSREPKFRIGDKVVPHTKSGGCNLHADPYWTSVGRKQGYLIVTNITSGSPHYSRDTIVYALANGNGGGNHYAESDLTPYAENEDKLFELLVHGHISQQDYERRVRHDKS